MDVEYPFQNNRADAREALAKARTKFRKKAVELKERGLLVYKCGYKTCDKYFYNEKDLRKHLKTTAHKMIPKPNRWVTPSQTIYKCGYLYCNATFINKKDAKAHMLSHIREALDAEYGKG